MWRRCACGEGEEEGERGGPRQVHHVRLAGGAGIHSTTDDQPPQAYRPVRRCTAAHARAAAWWCRQRVRQGREARVEPGRRAAARQGPAPCGMGLSAGCVLLDDELGARGRSRGSRGPGMKGGRGVLGHVAPPSERSLTLLHCTPPCCRLFHKVQVSFGARRSCSFRRCRPLPACLPGFPHGPASFPRPHPSLLPLTRSTFSLLLNLCRY